MYNWGVGGNDDSSSAQKTALIVFSAISVQILQMVFLFVPSPTVA